MTTFEDFKAKISEIKEATESYEELVKKSLAEFWQKYVASFEFPGETFIDKNGKNHLFATLINSGRTCTPDSVHVGVHDGIVVKAITVIDNSDLNNLREERFELNIKIVNGCINYKVTGIGFFDGEKFPDVQEDKDYIEVVDYIKSAFMNNVLKDLPGAQENLNAE